MKKTVHKSLINFIICFLLLTFSKQSIAQFAGDFRSTGSGNWNTSTTWERYSGSTWDASGVGANNPGQTPIATTGVFIQSNHTVTLTANESCNNLHIASGVASTTSGSLLGKVALGTFSLNVNGKIRDYYGAVNTFPTTNQPNGYPIYPFTSTTGKVVIVGTTRTIFNSGEWGAVITNGSTGNFPFEINMNSSMDTATFGTNVKFSSINLISGVISCVTIGLDNGTTGQGDATIGSGTTLISSATSTANIFQRTGSTRGGHLLINGTLKPTGTTPRIAMNLITNNGTIDYGKNGDQSFLTAVSSGAVINNYNNLIISGGGVKTLVVPVAVNGVLTLTDGTVSTTSVNLLTISSTGSSTAALANSFVNGPIKKIGNTAFTFPTGKKGTPNRVGQCAISATGLVTDEYTAEYFQTPYGITTLSGALTGVSSGEYWDISRVGMSTPNVTLFWADNVFSGVNAGNYNLTDLTMAHYNSGITAWEVQTSNTLGGTALNGSITANAVNSFSPFTLGSLTATTLPIAVNSFTASKQNSNTNAINWKATCTGASVSFELQRSTNGIVFVPINSFTATQARCAATFNYVDNYNATSPITYYKLKVISNTGEVKYSQIVAINNKNANTNTMALYPNITKGNAVLVVESKTTTNANFVITDAKGAIVRRFTESLSEGANAYPINVSNLSAGNYQITGIIDGALKTIRFIKE